MKRSVKKRMIIGLTAAVFFLSALPGVVYGTAAADELSAEKDGYVNGIEIVGTENTVEDEGVIVNFAVSERDFSKTDSLVFEIQNDSPYNRIYPFVIVNGHYFEFAGASLGQVFEHKSHRTLSGLANQAYSKVWHWSGIDKGAGLGVVYSEIPLTSFAYRGTFANFGGEETNDMTAEMSLSTYKEKNAGLVVSAAGVRIKSDNSAENRFRIGNIYKKSGTVVRAVYNPAKVTVGEWCSMTENTCFLTCLRDLGTAGGASGALTENHAYGVRMSTAAGVPERMAGYFDGINLKEYEVANSAQGEYMRISAAAYEGSLQGKTVIIPYYDRAGNGVYFDMKLRQKDGDYGIDGATIYYISAAGEYYGNAVSNWSVEPPAGFVGYICIDLDSASTEWKDLEDKTGVSLDFGFYTGWNGEKLYDIDLGNIRVFDGNIGTEHSFNLRSIVKGAEVIYPLSSPDTPDHIAASLSISGVMKNAVSIRSVEDVLEYEGAITERYPWLKSAKITDVRNDPPKELLPVNNSFIYSAGIEITGNRMWAATMTGGATEPNPDNIYMIMYSDDNGATWMNPAFVIDDANSSDELRIFGGSLWEDPQGRLWIFYSQTDGNFGTGEFPVGAFAYVIENPQDDPKQFRIVDKGLVGYGVFLNKPTVITNGSGDTEWIRSGHVTWTEYTDVYSSTDNGKTWRYKGSAHGTAGGAHESQIVQLSDGKLMMTKRIDGCESGGVEIAYSSDYGATWTEFESNLAEPFRAPSSRMNLYRLKSGNLIFVANDNRTVWNNLTVYMSEDDGKTWPYRVVIDERGGSAYPDTVQVENGNIYVAYERGRTDQAELRYSMFTEEDIKAGRFVSANHVFRRVITKNPKYQDVTAWTAKGKGGRSFLRGTSKESVLEALGNVVSVTTDQNRTCSLEGEWRCSYFDGNTPGTYLFKFQIYDAMIEDSYNLITTEITVTSEWISTAEQPGTAGKADDKKVDGETSSVGGEASSVGGEKPKDTDNARTEHTGSPGTEDKSDKNSKTSGSIAVMIAAVVIGILLIGGVTVLLLIHRKQNKQNPKREQKNTGKEEEKADE